MAIAVHPPPNYPLLDTMCVTIHVWQSPRPAVCLHDNKDQGKAPPKNKFKPNKSFENPNSTIFVKLGEKSWKEKQAEIENKMIEKEINVNVNSVRQVGNNVIISTQSEEDVEKLKRLTKGDKDIEIHDFKKRNPKVIISGLPENVTGRK